MLCLILFGILQVSYLIASKDVISFAATAACRAATVGMRDEFVNRVVHTTSIPTAGPMVDSPFAHTTARVTARDWSTALEASPSSEQYWMEKYAIPYYLGAIDESRLASILNYYNWVNGGTAITASARHTDDSVSVFVRQNVPLSFPFARAFYYGNLGTMTRQDGIHVVPRSPIDAELQLENHSSLYLTTE
jgi:hypothetical protein